MRDNILFGLPFDEARYNAAIEVASLIDDLLQMPGTALVAVVCPFASIVWLSTAKVNCAAGSKALAGALYGCVGERCACRLTLHQQATSFVSL